jgi:hypothetical protein
VYAVGRNPHEAGAAKASATRTGQFPHWRNACFLLPITLQRIDLKKYFALSSPFSLQCPIHDRLS